MKKIVPHVSIILSGMFVTFLVISLFNNNMDFIGSPHGRLLLLLLCISSVLTSTFYIRQQLKAARRHYERMKERMTKQSPPV